MSDFKYDLVTLFKLIEERPCIWNKNSEGYKNKTLREKSWFEIFYLIDEDFEDKTEEEKKKIGEIIQQKWTNVRDAFIRSLKIKRGQTLKRKYLYFEHLKFLLSSYKINQVSNNVSQTSQCEKDSSTGKPSFSRLSCTSKEMKREKRDISYDEEENVSKNKLTKTDCVDSVPKHYSLAQSREDTFFTSFVPYIKDMSEEEKLELHMVMIKAIKQIKQNRVSST